MTAAFLAGVLDTLLPGGDGQPAASELGIVVPGHEEVLAAIAAAAGGPEAFLAATPAARAAVLRAVEAGPQAAAFRALSVAVAQEYYLADAVTVAMGWRLEPPQPAGHALPPTDAATWERLEKVRARAPLWRPVG